MEMHSSIKPLLKQNVLLRGTLVGGLGVLIITYAGVFLPMTILKTWGLPLFLIGIALVTIGLLPYRRLCRLEVEPDKIVANADQSLSFFLRGRLTLTIPASCIESVEYFDEGKQYGIGVRLVKSPKEKIVIHAPHFNVAKYQKWSQKHDLFDLYFGYFSRRAFHRLSYTHHE